MRILSIATADQGGGAEQVAWDVFAGLEERGHESYLAVGEKHSDHERVFEIHASPWFDYRPYCDKQQQRSWNWERRWRRFLGLENFTHPYSWCLPELTPEPPDVIIAHNLHGGYFDLRALPEISARIPTVAVMHDYWLMTGHCAYPFACSRWQTGCGKCPYLSTPPSIRQDATRANLRRKRSIYRQGKFAVCSPSKSLLNEAQQSVLNDDSRTFHCIPNGVDLDLFRPGNRDSARNRLGLPMNETLVLLLGKQIDENPFKDFDCALQCARELDSQGKEATFVILGGSDETVQQAGKIRLLHVPYVSDRRTVAEYFRACDVLLHATRQEVAPLVLSEAMASGLPAVTSDAGNAAGLIGNSGFAVPSGDATSHAEALAHLLDDPELRDRMGHDARRRAEESGGKKQMVAAYEELIFSLARKS